MIRDLKGACITNIICSILAMFVTLLVVDAFFYGLAHASKLLFPRFTSLTSHSLVIYGIFLAVVIMICIHG